MVGDHPTSCCWVSCWADLLARPASKQPLARSLQQQQHKAVEKLPDDAKLLDAVPPDGPASMADAPSTSTYGLEPAPSTSSCTPEVEELANSFRRSKCEDLVDAEQIRKDLHRTFPKHGEIRSYVARVEEVLQGYALNDPSVGYCQGMNCIAAIVVMHLKPDWSAAAQRFDNFIAGMRELWLVGFPLFFVAASAFEVLGRALLPELRQHFHQCGICDETLATGVLAGEWLSLFARWLPFAALWSVFELVEAENLPGLLGITVVLLQEHATELLEVNDFTALFILLKDLGCQPKQPDMAHLLASVRDVLPAARKAVTEAQSMDVPFVYEVPMTRSGSLVIHSQSHLELVVTDEPHNLANSFKCLHSVCEIACDHVCEKVTLQGTEVKRQASKTVGQCVRRLKLCGSSQAQSDTARAGLPKRIGRALCGSIQEKNDDD